MTVTLRSVNRTCSVERVSTSRRATPPQERHKATAFPLTSAAVRWWAGPCTTDRRAPHNRAERTRVDCRQHSEAKASPRHHPAAARESCEPRNPLRANARIGEGEPERSRPHRGRQGPRRRPRRALQGSRHARPTAGKAEQAQSEIARPVSVQAGRRGRDPVRRAAGAGRSRPAFPGLAQVFRNGRRLARALRSRRRARLRSAPGLQSVRC